MFVGAGRLAVDMENSSRPRAEEEPLLLAALRAAHAALDAAAVLDEDGHQVGWVSGGAMSPVQLAEAVRLQASLEGRVSGLRLHTVAAADVGGAAETTASTDADAWAARAGRNRARSWGGAWLADLLETKYAHVRAGLASGRLSEEHASIIVRAAERVPEGVTLKELADCEERLVHRARTMSPSALRRAARRLLDPISKRLADTHENTLLQDQERRAELETWMTLGDNGNGTWSGRFTIPELHGHLLKHALEQLSSPRRHSRTRSGAPVEDVTLPGAGSKSYTEALGAALCELLEHLPAEGHGPVGVTLVVHIDEEHLRGGIGAASLESGADISAEEARRLSCGAGIMPLVCSGRSLPLDLGSRTRLFSRAQAVALSAVHDSCAAVGCDRPFAWCELHHKVPWGQGGRTDLDNAVPLCGHHHRRVHDPTFEHEWLPDGTVEFRRGPSRRTRHHDPWCRHAPAA